MTAESLTPWSLTRKDRHSKCCGHADKYVGSTKMCSTPMEHASLFQARSLSHAQGLAVAALRPVLAYSGAARSFDERPTAEGSVKRPTGHAAIAQQFFQLAVCLKALLHFRPWGSDLHFLEASWGSLQTVTLSFHIIRNSSFQLTTAHFHVFPCVFASGLKQDHKRRRRS